MSTAAIPVTYQQTLFLFVWYTIELIANLAVIYYVALTAGFIKPFRLVRNDVPTEMRDSWSQTGVLINNAVGIAKKVNQALNGAEETGATNDEQESGKKVRKAGKDE